MATRFVYDYRGVGEFMRTSPELSARLAERAVMARDFARAIAPTGTPQEGDHHPGHFRDSIDSRGPGLSGKRDRISYAFGSDADYATAVEAEHQVFGRTVAALGDAKGGEGL
jgi:hypothetical protein